MTAIAHPISQADLLQQQLERLRDNGEQGFDPVRFRFLEALWQRAGQQRETVRRILLDKLQYALDAYTSDCVQAKALAEKRLQALHSHPQIEQLQTVFQKGDFKEVLRLADKMAVERLLRAEQALASLTEQLSNLKLTKAEPEDNNPFENLLLQQDQETLSAIEELAATGEAAAIAGLISNQPNRGLAAGRHLRFLMRKHHEDTLITQALQRAPEDPGPLNAHKLLISALSTMRELSPKYVGRFAAYGETLLWLEEMDRKESAGNKNKP